MYSTVLLVHCAVILALAKTCPWSCTCQKYNPPSDYSWNASARDLSSVGFQYVPAASVVYQEYPDAGDKESENEQPTGETEYDCILKYNDSLSNLLSSINTDVRRLSLRKSRLTSVTTICHFTKLEELDLSWNDFSHVLTYESYVICINLWLLNLSHNHIKELRRDEFASFPYLETLDVSHNEISSVSEDTFRLPRLRRLALTNNGLSQIPARVFRFLSQLRKLDLSSNHFESFDFATMIYLINIEELDLSDNRIRFIHSKAFDDIGRLKSLNLAGNRLTTMPPSIFLKYIENLVLDRNPIEVLERSDTFPMLRNLSISNMPLLELVLKRSFSQLPNLRVLKMHNNSRLLYFSPTAFDENPFVEVLDLQWNSLNYLSHSIFSLPRLRDIRIAKNPLQLSCFKEVPDTLLRKSDIFPLTGAKQECKTELYPQLRRTEIRGRIGAPLRLYCVVMCHTGETNITWDSSMWSSRYKVNDEFLLVEYTDANDTNTFVCTATQMGTVVGKREISVTLIIPNFTVLVRKLAPYYVTVGWNRSSTEDRFGFYLRYRLANPNFDAESGWITSPPLSLYPSSYSLTNLAPFTNYTICTIYRPRDEILQEDCTTVQTPNLIYNEIGLSLSYTLIAIIAGISLTCCTLCCIRSTYHRFHVWQREKVQSRMQESISAQGFFSSFDSISTANVAVTYENPHRSEAAVDGSPEEAVKLVKHDAQLHNAYKVERHAEIEMTNSPNGRAPSTMTM